MRLIDKVVGVALLIGFAIFMQTSVQPPDDFWFQSVVCEESRPVLVKFGAEWCGPCQQMEAVLDRVASDVSGAVKIVRIDIDEKPELASHYGVSSIPRIFLFKNGRVVASHGGFPDAKSVQEWLDRKI